MSFGGAEPQLGSSTLNRTYKRDQKLLLSFSIAPLATSGIHTVRRESGSIPDLMLLQE